MILATADHTHGKNFGIVRISVLVDDFKAVSIDNPITSDIMDSKMNSNMVKDLQFRGGDGNQYQFSYVNDLLKKRDYFDTGHVEDTLEALLAFLPMPVYR